MRPYVHAKRVNVGGYYQEVCRELYSLEPRNYEAQIGFLESMPAELGALRHYLREQICRVISFRHLYNGDRVLKHVARYAGLCRLADTFRPLWIYTLNHDVCVELICSGQNIPVAPRRSEDIGPGADSLVRVWWDDDFIHQKDFFVSGELGVNVVKLHGAINEFYSVSDDRGPAIVRFIPGKDHVEGWKNLIWFLINQTAESKGVEPAPYGFIQFPLPVEGLELVRSSILTGRAKLTDRGTLNNPKSGLGVVNLGICQVTMIPYVNLGGTASVDFHAKLFGMFSANIRYLQRLITIGYSFRDDHVNHVIRAWMSQDRKRKLEIVDPFRQSVPDCLREMTEQVRVIRQSAIEWLDSLIGRRRSRAEHRRRRLNDTIWNLWGRTSEEKFYKALYKRKIDATR